MSKIFQGKMNLLSQTLLTFIFHKMKDVYCYMAILFSFVYS